MKGEERGLQGGVATNLDVIQSDLCDISKGRLPE